jgi:hypothetical protein
MTLFNEKNYLYHLIYLYYFILRLHILFFKIANFCYNLFKNSKCSSAFKSIFLLITATFFVFAFVEFNLISFTILKSDSKL